MIKKYYFVKATNNYVVKDDKGRVLETVPIGTVIDSTKGRCRLGPNGKVEYLPREAPNVNRVINNLWPFENPANKGFDPASGLYYPFTTNNGNHDVAFGIDLDQNPGMRAEASRGISKQRANEFGKQRLEPKIKKIDEALGQYTERPDTISPQIKEGLLDMLWQLGDKGLLPCWSRILASCSIYQRPRTVAIYGRNLMRADALKSRL